MREVACFFAACLDGGQRNLVWWDSLLSPCQQPARYVHYNNSSMASHDPDSFKSSINLTSSLIRQKFVFVYVADEIQHLFSKAFSAVLS